MSDSGQGFCTAGHKASRSDRQSQGEWELTWQPRAVISKRKGKHCSLHAPGVQGTLEKGLIHTRRAPFTSPSLPNRSRRGEIRPPCPPMPTPLESSSCVKTQAVLSEAKLHPLVSIFLTTEMPLRTPNSQEAKPQMQTISAGGDICPGRALGSGNSFQPEQLGSTCLSASHLSGEANVPQGAAPASPLHLLSRTYRQGQTGIPSHHRSIHQICHRITLTISKSLIYPPQGQGKRKRHRLQKRFRIKISKMCGAVATALDYGVPYSVRGPLQDRSHTSQTRPLHSRCAHIIHLLSHLLAVSTGSVCYQVPVPKAAALTSSVQSVSLGQSNRLPRVCSTLTGACLPRTSLVPCTSYIFHSRHRLKGAGLIFHRTRILAQKGCDLLKAHSACWAWFSPRMPRSQA